MPDASDLEEKTHPASSSQAVPSLPRTAAPSCRQLCSRARQLLPQPPPRRSLQASWDLCSLAAAERIGGKVQGKMPSLGNILHAQLFSSATLRLAQNHAFSPG